MASKLNLSSPYAKITRNLHLFMLILCAIASIALYIVQSWLSKAILTLILIAYAAFLIRNSQIFTLLFRITGTQARSDYAKVREWGDASTPNEDQHAQDKSHSHLSKKSLLDGTFREQASMGSIDRSMLRDESISSYRGLSASYMNDSHISSSRVKTVQSRGHDLFELSIFNERSQTKSVGRSSVSSEKAFQIMDRKSIARKRLHSYKSESQKIYEEQLVEIKKSAKYVQSRYRVILNTIHAIINPIINQHKSNTAKIQEISLEFLDVSIDEKSRDIQNYILGLLGKKMTNQTLKISLQGLIQRYLEVYGRKEPMQYSKLPLRSTKKWNDFQKKINELLRNRIRLAQTMGVQTQALTSQIRKGVAPFIQQYNTYITMIQEYISTDLNRKAYENPLQDLSDESLVKEFKNRIYILYLYVKNLNNLLRGCVKIDLKDYLGFKSMVPDGNADIQISPKYSFDAYIPYFNLHLLEKKERKKCYPCEYGNQNYLSIIYFLLVCLSKRVEVRERMDVVRIVNETL